MSLAACGVSHQGRRSSNEDAWLVDLDNGLLVVADGMGGHNAGEVASALAVTTIQAAVSASSNGDALQQAVLRANEAILVAASARPERSGMGTTVVVALVRGARAYFTSVGDSRLYLWRDGQLRQLTRDDSWLSETFGGEMWPADAQSHPMRHVLTRVVGIHRDLEPVVAECPLRMGDILVLCSDGVHGALSQDRLAEIVGANRPVAELAAAVVEIALDSGATDNATVIVARCE